MPGQLGLGCVVAPGGLYYVAQQAYAVRSQDRVNPLPFVETEATVVGLTITATTFITNTAEESMGVRAAS
eukprot:SAG22_NODE_3323_length_1779_cov_1.822619_1_plen_70_part_00